MVLYRLEKAEKAIAEGMNALNDYMTAKSEQDISRDFKLNAVLAIMLFVATAVLAPLAYELTKHAIGEETIKDVASEIKPPKIAGDSK